MKIAIVNDSAIIAEALRRIVTAAADHEVAWIAHNGADAIRMCAADRPDLILMDLIMPNMDGIEATRHIMQHTPCAILIVTAAPNDHVDPVFRALGAGALDVTAVPRQDPDAIHTEGLLRKIKMIGKLIQADRKAFARGDGKSPPGIPAKSATGIQTLVAIGSSTGGPIALAKVLAGLTVPANACVVVVQHIDERFADTFATWLATQTHLPVQVIEEGSSLVAGHVLVAKTNDHLLMDKHGRLKYSPIPREYPYRPSVDVFFHCIADHWRHRAIGVLLTGMGRDGAAGLLAMRCAGKLTITQDESSSAVYGMPRAAAELDAADLILPLSEIAMKLRDHMLAEDASGT